MLYIENEPEVIRINGEEFNTCLDAFIKRGNLGSLSDLLWAHLRGTGVSCMECNFLAERYVDGYNIGDFRTPTGARIELGGEDVAE